MKKYDKVRQATDDTIIRHIRIEYWITNATNTQILGAFPWRQWLHEGYSMLRLYLLWLPCISSKFYIVNEMLILNSVLQ